MEQQNERHSMKKTAIILALALGVSAGAVLAQDAGGPPPDNGGPPPGQNGPGGFGGGGNFGNFDPAQFQQRMMDNTREQLGFTKDTDWAAIQPLIQKVMDTRTAIGGRGGFGGFGGGRGGRGGPGGGGFGGQTASVEPQALQSAIDNDSPAAQIKAALERYEATQKTKQATLAAAQDALRGVLSAKQEAQATLMGLLP
jgi:hypothetical protein